MNKTQLIEAVANGAGLTLKDTARVIDSLKKTVMKALQSGEQIVLPGFISISTGNRAARTGRNPQTNEVINIAARRVVKLKAGKSLKEAVQ